uniref:Transcription regulator protein BACH1-like n=1 Tax=Sinocyclocheilus grahami TaxID=75366 RepID=A0A672T443_SINGR
MSVDGPRTSVFTFQSAVHSHHVLRSLEELRQKELLCDVTVEVERRSFRAHSSVLASCSDYFYTRLTNRSRPNPTVRLPDERSEKEKLLQDHNQLKLSIEDVRQNLSGLCQSLSTDAAPQSEQLQALARYFSSDCPTSILLTPMASPSLAGPDQDAHANSSLDTFLADTCPEGDTVALRSPTAFLQDNVQSTVTDPAP